MLRLWPVFMLGLDPAMVLHQEDVLSVAAAATAGAAPPGTVTAAAGAVGATPLTLRRNVVVVVTAKTPLLGRPPSTSASFKLAFFFPLLVGMVTRFNAEFSMLPQKWKNEGLVM
jgi:hypothetical protein